MLRIMILFLILQITTTESAEWKITYKSNNPLYRICLNEQIGGAIGAGGSYCYTIDAGLTWQKQYSGTDAYLNYVGFTPDGGIMLTGYKGTLVYYSKPGSNFEDRSLEPVYNLQKFYFVDNYLGFLLTFNSYLLKTTDGGKTWEENHSFKEFPDLRSLTSDKNTVYVISTNGDSSALYSSVDKGENWILTCLFKGEKISKIHYQNGVLWASGGGGAFCSSKDGPKTWTWYQTGLHHYIEDFAIEDNQIWLYCWWENDRRILKSADNGKSWYEFDSSPCDWSGSMQIIGEKIFVAENYNGIIKWINKK